MNNSTHDQVKFLIKTVEKKNIKKKNIRHILDIRPSKMKLVEMIDFNFRLENERMKEALLNRDNREDESSADLKNYKSIEP